MLMHTSLIFDLPNFSVFYSTKSRVVGYGAQSHEIDRQLTKIAMTKNVLVLICSLRAKSSQNRTAALAETGPRLVLNLAYVLLQMNSPFRV